MEKNRHPVFETLDIIADIAWHYFVLSQISENKELTAKEVRKYSMRHYIGIIHKKKKIGYDTTLDEKAHAEIKAYKVTG